MDKKNYNIEIFFESQKKSFVILSKNKITLEEVKSRTMKEFDIQPEFEKDMRFSIILNNRLITILNDYQIMKNFEEMSKNNFYLKINFNVINNNYIYHSLSSNSINKIKDDVYYANRLIWERMQKVNEMTQWRKNSNKKLLCGTSVECEKNEFNLEKEVNIITSLKDFYNTKTGKKMCFTIGGMKKYKHNFDEILYDRGSFLDIPNYILCKQWNDIYKDAADRKVIDNLFACLAKISHVKLFMHPKAHGGKLKSTNIWHMAINDKYRLKYKYINNESCMDKKINPDYIKFNDNVKYGIVEIVGNIEHT